MHMETQSTQASPTDDGGLSLHSSTQWLDLTQRSAAQMTGMPAGLIRVTIPRIGGAYGGKITRSLMVSSACAVAAKLTGVPVRCVVGSLNVYLWSDDTVPLHPFSIYCVCSHHSSRCQPTCA